MSKDEGYLLDIVLAAKKAARFLGESTRDDFDANEMLQDALMMQIAVIGEAVRHISDEFKATHPEVPWAKIRHTRNIVTHAYGAVDLHKVWEAVTVGLPQLIVALEPLIPPETPPET